MVQTYVTSRRLLVPGEPLSQAWTMPSVFEIAEAARAAATRIERTVTRTPLLPSPALSEQCGGEVYLKLENRQRTGSFKLRGATNRLLTLSAEQRARGCVAASSGNHGAALAYAMRDLGTDGVIFVPEQTSAKKIAAIREYGGDVRRYGIDGLDTEVHARAYAEAHGMFYVSPYNDVEVIAGQGTCGIEIVDELPEFDVLFVAVGGGGLVGGVGSVVREALPAVRIVGCQPAASAVMARSVAAGRILDLPSEPTLSDGTAGGIEADAITFDLARSVVDEFMLVSEPQIAASMRDFMRAHDDVIEGAAGVAVAAMLARPDLTRGRTSVVLICGGNVSDATLQSLR